MITQLSLEIFNPRKMDSNFLEANLGYFRLSTARDNKNDGNCPSSFLIFGLKVAKFCFEPEKNGPKINKIE